MYTYTSSYNELNGPFFLTSSTQPNALIINGTAAAQYFITASTFVPNPITQQYYTPIIDLVSVQQGDLIRLDNYKTQNPQYYTVISAATPVTRSPVTLTGTFADNYTPSLNLHFYSFTFPFTRANTRLFQINDNVTISGTALNNVAATITSIYLNIFGGTITLFFDYNTTTIVNEPSVPAVFDFYNNNPLTIVLDRNLSIAPPPGASSFAILRPKPDETSVIIDYKKQPGLVAQSLLIPNDASTLLKDSIGTIFESLNIQLG